MGVIVCTAVVIVCVLWHCSMGVIVCTVGVIVCVMALFYGGNSIYCGGDCVFYGNCSVGVILCTVLGMECFYGGNCM